MVWVSGAGAGPRTVAGVTSFGLFVELIESRVSGLVHITQLPNDYYHFEPKKHLLSGERRPGTEVKKRP